VAFRNLPVSASGPDEPLPTRRQIVATQLRGAAVFARDWVEADVFSAVVGVRTTDRVVALTYDDGPTPEITERVGTHLADRGHFATFFVLLPRATAHPALIHGLLAHGHQIGLHGFAHVRLSQVGNRELLRTLRDSRARLEDLTQEPIRMMRPPYGAQSRASYLLARLAGFEIAGWATNPMDYRHGSLDSILAQLPRNPVPGSVVLLHDGDGEACDGPLSQEESQFKLSVTSSVTDWLATSGLRSCTLDSLMSQYPVVTARWVRGNQ